MERIKKGAELAASRHGYRAGELTVAGLCPYSSGIEFSRRHGTKAIKRRVTPCKLCGEVLIWSAFSA